MRGLLESGGRSPLRDTVTEAVVPPDRNRGHTSLLLLDCFSRTLRMNVVFDAVNCDLTPRHLPCSPAKYIDGNGSAPTARCDPPCQLILSCLAAAGKKKQKTSSHHRPEATRPLAAMMKHKLVHGRAGVILRALVPAARRGRALSTTQRPRARPDDPSGRCHGPSSSVRKAVWCVRGTADHGNIAIGFGDTGNRGMANRLPACCDAFVCVRSSALQSPAH